MNRDIDGCDPMTPFKNTIYESEFSATREISSITGNIDSIVKNYIQSEYSSQQDTYRYSKFIFYSDEAMRRNHNIEDYVKEAQKKDYKKVSCLKANSLGTLLRSEIEKLINKTKEESVKHPIVCLLMNESQFLLIAAFLK